MEFVQTYQIKWKIKVVKQLTPPGKPPTWFPGEGLVTQARLFIRHQICLLNALDCHRNANRCHFKCILKLPKFDPEFAQLFEISFGMDFFRIRTLSFENLDEICPNVSNWMQNWNVRGHTLTFFHENLYFSCQKYRFSLVATDANCLPMLTYYSSLE